MKPTLIVTRQGSSPVIIRNTVCDGAVVSYGVKPYSGSRRLSRMEQAWAKGKLVGDVGLKVSRSGNRPPGREQQMVALAMRVNTGVLSPTSVTSSLPP